MFNRNTTTQTLKIIVKYILSVVIILTRSDKIGFNFCDKNLILIYLG